MADAEYQDLGRRRRVYELRSRLGFEGYVPGSWPHALQALLHPLGSAFVAAASIAAASFMAITVALVRRGGHPGYTAAFSAALVLGLWLVASAISFAWRTRRVRAVLHPPPPSPPSGPRGSGVREPRRPRPDPPDLSAELDPPRPAV